MKMSPFSCEEVAAVGGRLRSPAKKQVLTGVSTDSRNLGRQDLFVALRGPLHDAHRFIRPEMQPLPGRGGRGRSDTSIDVLAHD